MQHKRLLKIPSLPLLIFKTQHTKLLTSQLSPSSSILFTNQGIQISSDQELATDELYTEFETILQKFSFHRVVMTNPSGKKFFSQSPLILKYMGSNHCHVSMINQQIYVSSVTKTNEEIEGLVKKYSSEDVWTLPFKNPKHINPLYNEITLYLEKLFQFKKQQFQKLQTTIEINTDRSHFLIWGGCDNNKMEAKNILKDLVYSTSLLEIRAQLDIKQSRKFLGNCCEYPIVMNQHDPGVYRLTSKTNVLLKLLSLEKFLTLTGLHQGEIGLFLFEEKEFGPKRSMVESFATEKKLFIEEKYSFLYFNACLDIKGASSKQGIVDTLKQVLGRLIEKKPKRQSKPQRPKKMSEKVKKSQGFCTFGEKFEFEESKQYCLMFGCDVVVQKVYLSKGYLERYQGQEESRVRKGQVFTCVDWCPADATQVLQVQRGEMRGRFFYGTVKESTEGTLYLPELLITTIHP